MINEWYAIKELVGLPGLGGAERAIQQRAKNENWRRRKAPGVRGRAYEYHIESFPMDTRAHLLEAAASLENTKNAASFNEEADSMIPIYDIAASAGPGNAARNFVGHELFSMSAEVFKTLGITPKSLFLIPVMGDSMEPTLHDGDHMLVMTRDDDSIPIKGGIYVLRHGEDLMVKRLDFDTDQRVLTVRSDNPDYSTKRLKDSDLEQISIIGEVVRVIAKIRKHQGAVEPVSNRTSPAKLSDHICKCGDDCDQDCAA
ncbi:hypothetical protein F9L16_19215 [Agarivorans sp. B2Z047]|uniref:helix-turn-helix domain-containing protein n=1 Tax=Agarivorans sp. B2Z047 TaxID=2652721 RepID=UPI00128C3CB0|nr:S24 family peptidase [Agarivorans sp. B2Z047]MPW31112.1 hypothetical protein [Agarivorans sp. B2Z047]UQN40660.1 helix-turn-helix transcriptional regulator [Agarivorans sp. B2Z047]